LTHGVIDFVFERVTFLVLGWTERMTPEPERASERAVNNKSPLYGKSNHQGHSVVGGGGPLKCRQICSAHTRFVELHPRDCLARRTVPTFSLFGERSLFYPSNSDQFSAFLAVGERLPP
jgi:hypothetical protein